MSLAYLVYNSSWEEVWSSTVFSNIPDCGANESVLHEYVVMFLSNKRQSTAHTKTRSEVRRSWRKLYRQKWTWSARVGDAWSPIRRKWWVVFWPRNNRNRTKQMNKRMKRLALICAIHKKYHQWWLLGVRDFSLDSIKTSVVVSMLSRLPLGKKVLLVWESYNNVLYRSVRNISNVRYLPAQEVNAYDIVSANSIVFIGESSEQLKQRIS